MNLKDLFSKAENGTLTYEQAQSLIASSNAKFVDLSEGNYVDRNKYNSDISARDTRINTLDETLKTRDTDLTSLREQLQSAGADTEKLNSINTQFAELQKKYDKETRAYEKQLKEQAYKFAVTDFANKKSFTSNAAKRDFVNSMLAKNLQMEGDTIIGATDFVDAYTKENADAFVVEKADDKNTPHFVEPTEQKGTPEDTTDKFKFNFTGVRLH